MAITLLDFPSSGSLSDSTSQRLNWLLLDLNSFFASCEQQERPELRGKPVAVVAMKTDSTSVLAASYEAKKYGIKTGVRVSDARRMCPGLIFVETHHRLYLDYHHRILEAVEEIIPIHSVLSVDEVACELTGSQREVPKALELARRLKKHVQNRVGVCLTSSVGLGPNTLIAKMASDMQKPDGLVWVPRDEIQKKMGELSIRCIPGVGARMEAHLNRVKIYKVSDLLKLSAGQSRSAWGSILGVRTVQALKGEHFVYEVGETKSIGHEHVLPPDFRNPTKAYEVALKLLNKAAVRLRKSQFRCRKLSLSVRFVDSHNFENSIKFNETTDTSFLIRQLQGLWNFTYSKPLLKVSIVLSDFEHRGDHQLSFFDQDNSRREKAFQIVDRLNERFGKDTIYVARLFGMKSKASGGIAFSRVPDREEFAAELQTTPERLLQKKALGGF
jgi:DNA polymerase IV